LPQRGGHNAVKPGTLIPRPHLSTKAGQVHTFTFASVTPNQFFPGFPVTQTATLTTKLDFLGTIRARGGYLWDPSFLTYVTAGLAYGEVELNSSITQNVVGGAPFVTPLPIRL
jgi:hypothetical protein